MASEVNGNSTHAKEEEEPMDISNVTHTEHYQTLIDAGLPQEVAERLDDIFQTGMFFTPTQGYAVLLCNKSAFLCGVMKTYRQREKQGNKVQESTKGPDESKIKALLDRTGYTLDVTTGQRKYGGPPPEEIYLGQQPGVGTEPDDKKKNRGFCFLEYEDHKSAAQARRRLMSGKVKVWGNPVTVEWADPVEEPDPDIMAKVKVLFVRNLATPVTEELLEKTFSEFGKLERVKKLKDYAFVHFEDRNAAVKAMQGMNGRELEGEEIEIVLAKPPDKKRKERQAARQTTRNTGYEDYYYYPPPRMPPPVRGRGRGGRGGYVYPPDYYNYEEYYDDYYGCDYHDYRGGYEDPYYGYDDGYAVRGRGSRVSRGAPPLPRGRGAPPPRGRVGYSQRGVPMGAPRGGRGGRGGPSQQQRGRGVRGARGNRGGNVGGKRKADVYNQPDSKRRQTNNQQNWGSQPIAQQPLQQGGDYSGNYGYNNDNQEFYQDSYGQQWK
ncbi:UNVERIFIED_CONTAM: hypothetical protein FKN15_009276 [Acipenser sinensis]